MTTLNNTIETQEIILSKLAVVLATVITFITACF